MLVGDQPYARHMVESLKDVHHCEVLQMSDLKTSAVPGVSEVIRLPFNIPLMLYRLKHLANLPEGDTLIVDTDVLAKHAIDDVWAQPFEIALTRRESGEVLDGTTDISQVMPYNTGVMLSRSRQFWIDCREWLGHQPENLHQWYGDQHAVAEVARREIFDVLELPCAEFNWSPNSRGETSEARFWHYKGAVRKKWIYTSAMTREKQLSSMCSATPSSSTPPSL